MRQQPGDPDDADLHHEDEALVTASVRKTSTLDLLIAAITEENRHDETEWGLPVGGEAW